MIICGIDEAGRGPLAGPVTAAAVVLPADFPVEILKDSKKLTAETRNRICALLLEKSLYGIGWVWSEEIDRINIHHASLLAMKIAFEELLRRRASSPEKSDLFPMPDQVLVDGLFTPKVEIPVRAIVKGDDKIDEIKAASIIAKTVRDKWMIRYSWIETEYFFEKHKGYPTKLHKKILAEVGPCPIHRKSFNWGCSCNLELWKTV